MPRRRKALLLLALGLFVCGLLVVLTREREPSYEGRTLSEWVATYQEGDPSEVRSKAIRHIGTNALPYLLAWIDYKPRTRKVVSITQKLPAWLRDSSAVKWLINRDEEREHQLERALRAFRDLGAIASPAIPELTRRANFINAPETAHVALFALAGIGPEAASSLSNVRSNRAHIETTFSMGYLAYFGTNARPLVPLLVLRLQSTNERIATESVQTLGSMRLEPNSVIPALAQALNDPRLSVQFQAAARLGEFGELARPALPALSNALNDPHPDVRDIASNAIWRITTAAATNTPAQ